MVILNLIALIKMAGEQQDLVLENRTWGGQRAGAGRKKSRDRRDPLHRLRPEHVARHPLHIVMRVRRDVPRLRTTAGFTAISQALAKAAALPGFRIVHASLQHNHLHLIIEAANKAALVSGMRSFAICLARRINALHGRTGKVFAYRYHATALTTPRQVRNTIAYVLNNWRRHHEDLRGPRQRAAILDPYSTAVSFDGWADYTLTRLPATYVPWPAASPETWLLREGWRRAGKPIRTRETPGPLAS